MTVFRVTPSLALIALGSALAVQSCAPSQDSPTPTSSLDLSHYVAVGDSYTAGVSNGGLTRTSQEYAYPNLLAKSFLAVAPTSTFTQPLLDAGAGTGYLTLVSYAGSGVPVVQRVPGTAVRGQVIDPSACGGPDTLRLLTRSATTSTLPQNLGIPGLRLSQIETTGLGNEAQATSAAVFNPYFERLLPAADGRTYLQAVGTAASSATFFTYFMGLDDLLPFVRSGGECGGLRTSTIRNQLLATMKASATKILTTLTADGRRGIIARLPDPGSLPLLQLGKGDVLQRRLQTAANDTSLRVYIQAHVGTSFSVRRISELDFVLATALPRVGRPVTVTVGGSSLSLPYGLDARAPLVLADVLESIEVTALRSTVNTHNRDLEALAVGFKFPALDATGSTLNLQEGLFNLVAERVAINGVPYSLEPVRGNFFSLDFYSLTPRGNGLLANLFIDAINTTYQSNIPAVDVNSLPTTAQ
jgi:hypothetical protein